MRQETANILAFLDAQVGDDPAMKIAGDFRRRRIEKELSRKRLAEKSGVAMANIARFEQKGLISLKNLIDLASVLGYLGELQGVFSEPKFSTMAELQQIRRNTGKKKAHTPSRI